MSGNEPTIEAEVLEIDGVAVEPKPFHQDSSKGTPRAQWRTWQSQVKRLDARWWPLWILIAFIAIVLVVAIGMVAIVCFVTWRMVVGLINTVVSLLLPSSGNLQRR